MTDEQRSKYMKTGKAAAYLGVSEGYLKKLANNGVIPVSRPSKRLHLYLVADLDKFVEEGRG